MTTDGNNSVADGKKIVFVLGGPGAGKGTQCAKLSSDFPIAHYSAGDLLRAERNNPDSVDGKMINEMIKNGEIVPSHITIGLLRNAIASRDDVSIFLIDGFPRNLEQMKDFETAVCPCEFVLFLDCPVDVMTPRLLARGSSSGRVDDNEESIRKRMQTHHDTCVRVIEHFQKNGKARRVDTNRPIDEVYEEVKAHFTAIL